MDENIATATATETEKEERFWPEDDYYDVKRFLELKQKVKMIFENPKRAEKVKELIKEKNKVKEELVTVSQNSDYKKALGITA